MDTLIFLVSAAVLVTLGYGVFWTVRAVRRVGLRRFAGALGALALAVMVAIAKLFNFKIDDTRASREDRRDDFIHVIEDLRIAREHQRLSEEGTLNPPSHE
ncbi:MAG: hypothetical protein ACREYC_27150 [Gammaproteobacteria bacterium]